MAVTNQVPDNIPVSWLDQLNRLDKDVLMLGSEPNSDTQTQYMSKYFTFGRMEEQVAGDLSIQLIREQLSDLYEGKASLSDYLDGTLSLDISDPYIMSSMTYAVSSDGRHFGPLSCSGYRLSAGVTTVFTNLNRKGLPLHTIIPQLGSKRTAVSNPTEYFISAINDQDGHVKSFEYGKMSEVVPSAIGDATVSASDGYAVSSVTTRGGKVTAVGAMPVSKVMYADYTGQSGAEDRFQHMREFYVMKLTNEQLQALSSSGKIRKDCIYMTVDDIIDDIDLLITDKNDYVATMRGNNIRVMRT